MELLDRQRIVTYKEMIEIWRNDFATLLNANKCIPHCYTAETKKLCEAEIPLQLSELISLGGNEGSWKLL